MTTGTTKYGFKDLNDLSDNWGFSRDTEYFRTYNSVTGEWTNEFEIANLPTQYFGDTTDTSRRPFNSGSTGGFKFFIPPGSLKIIVVCFHEGQTVVSMGARYRNIPTINSNMDPWNDTVTHGRGENLVLSDWIDDDQTKYFGNANGHNYILKPYLIPVDPITQINGHVTEEQAGWIYVNVYEGKTAVAMIQMGTEVRVDVYQPWYDNYDWDADSFGLQTALAGLDY